MEELRYLEHEVAMLTVRSRLSDTTVSEKGSLLREVRLEGSRRRRKIFMVHDNWPKERANTPTNESSSQARMAQDGLGGYDWSNDFEVEPVNYALMAISSSSSSSSSDNKSFHLRFGNSDDEEDEYGVQTVRPKTQTVKTRDDKSGQNSKKQGIGFRKLSSFWDERQVCLYLELLDRMLCYSLDLKNIVPLEVANAGVNHHLCFLGAKRKKEKWRKGRWNRRKNGGKYTFDAFTYFTNALVAFNNMIKLLLSVLKFPYSELIRIIPYYSDTKFLEILLHSSNKREDSKGHDFLFILIHKVHLKDQILGDPKSTVQTRGKIQKASSVQQALKNPRTISQALQDESRVEAMQEELLQFKLQKVWVLVDLPYGKKEEGIDYDEVFAPVARIEAIRLFLAFASYMGFTVYQMDVKSAFLYGTIGEEVYVQQPPGFVDPAHPNKVYKVIKALYGLHQAPRAWYETLSTFLLENGFRRGTIDKTLFIKKNKSDIMLVQVYVDDIIFGSTKQSMCTEFEDCMHKRFQMSSMGELTFFLGLQVQQQPDGIFISQDKYVADILKKFDFCSIRTATTPIESNKPLVQDKDGVDVDVHVYRSMIGSLMYLTASRPDIMFAVCACARDSPFELEAFSDSDYGGASLDRKSTTGGCQFLGRRLISWQCKKQTIVANSTTKAEYVAAANCCGQVLWIQNQMMDYGFNFMNTKIHIDNESTICIVKNPVYHSRTKHIEIRHHFIRDCYEKRLIDVVKIHTDNNVADLLTKGFDVTRFNFLVLELILLGNNMDLRMDGSCASNFSHIWVMANLKYSDKHNMVAFLKKPNESVGFTEIVDFLKVRTLAIGTLKLVASINNKEYTITEASVKSKLQLADATGISNLPDAEIYDGLATLGGYAGDYVSLLPTMLAGAAKDQDTEIPQSQGPTFTHVADEETTTGVRVGTEGATTTTFGLDAGLDNGNIHESPLRSREAPLYEGHTSRSAEDNLQLKELMILTTYGKAVLTLVERVKSLEVALKRKTKKVVVSDSEVEETENQGRKIQDIDDDPLVSLVRESIKEKDTYFVTLTKISASGEVQEQDISPTTLEAAKTLSQVISQKTKSTDKGIRYKRKTRSKLIKKDISTNLDADIEVNPDSEDFNTSNEDFNNGSLRVSTSSGPVSTPSVVQTTNVTIPSLIKSQREGKALMTTEEIQATKRTKAQIQQEEACIAEAMRLQAL
ncbi:putative ribonuclease H-like domain-containing protein [Tanacetum coccineum]|uniref:Ribonuclease H-like domain-containing protein n=1 Tax=Tanacetum coccineum TaxID=301880 RepID=A0ABQ5ET69_9ASTR